MNRELVEALCAQETAEWSHLLFGGPQRTFTPDFYAALEAATLAWCARLMQRAAMFARSRAYSIHGGPPPAKEPTMLCERDLNNGADLIVQEDAAE